MSARTTKRPTPPPIRNTAIRRACQQLEYSYSTGEPALLTPQEARALYLRMSKLSLMQEYVIGGDDRSARALARRRR